MATMLSEGGVEPSARRTGGAGRRRERRPGGPAAWAVAAVVSHLERPRGPPVTCAQQLPRSTGRDSSQPSAPANAPFRKFHFRAEEERLAQCWVRFALSLSLSESRSKNPLRAESARGPGLWATEESWEPREVSRVCCGAGHQDDQLSTERQVARPEFTASQPDRKST